MPFEMIDGRGYDIRVCWGKDDEFVQVASVIPDSQPGPADLPELVAQVNMEAARGLFATMTTREQCNKLIRTLRRARDSAFGADA